MRTVVFLLIAAIPAAYWIGLQRGSRGQDSSFIHLGATEAFNLRSACSKLAESLAQANHQISGATSRYDVRTNRCYTELHLDVANRLYDAQTGEILAEVWHGPSPSASFIRGGPKDVSPEDARAFIDRAMADDRKW